MTDRAAGARPLPEVVAACVGAGVDLVQVRARELGGRALLEHVLAIARAARAADPAVRVIVNRRVDVALAAGADGVHLGFDAMAVSEARALLGPDALIGVAAHDPTECADRVGASHAHLAPIFAPISKPGSRPPLGTAALREASAGGLPVLAQGGVTAANAARCLAAGAAGVAVTGTLLSADDPAAATRALRAALDAASR